jgi:hypothetical protein
VHALHDLAVDPPGGDAQLAPDLLTLERGLPEEDRPALLAAELLMEEPPSAVLIKASTTARAWSEWAAAPAATALRKFLAAIVSASAPQTPA